MAFMEEISPASGTPVELADNPYLPPLEAVIGILEDGHDHPEVWAALAQAAQQEDAWQVIDLVALLLPHQDYHLTKILRTVAAVLQALSSDHAAGLAALSQLSAEHAHCAQIAGAFFFVHRANDPDKSADLSDRFCESPFVKFETLMDGTVAPCCSIWTNKRLGRLNNQTFEQIWNSPDAQEMRASILDGSYRYCNKQRCTRITKDELPKRDEIVDPELRSVIDNNRIHMKSAPRWLFLAHDATCNLACPSCRTGIFASDERQEALFDKIETQVLQPLLNADGDVTISVSGQGDPWSSPHYRSILRYMADHDLQVKLNIHTNALLMGEARWAQYAGLDKYRALVDVSIDACSPWVYAVVRRPGNWEKLYPNLQFIAAKRAREEFREFHLNATIQLDNYHEMPALIDAAAKLGADSMRMYMVQNTGGHLASLYRRINIGDADHPLHLAFLETLRDEKLGLPIASLYDVATWRARAFDANLPSDRLGADYTRDDLIRALIEAQGDPATVVALCAGGRTRFRDDKDLLLVEAQALHACGFSRQGQYRINELVALGGEAVVLG